MCAQLLVLQVPQPGGVSSPLSASGPLLLFLSVSNKVQLNLDSVILEVFSSLNGFCDFLILQPLTQNPP